MLWESENRAEQCRILQIGTVDAGNGTLFGTRNKRAIQRDHLTLVIGSGGMGAAAIHAAVQKARQNLVSDFDNYTKFILVDSDRREIDRMEKEQIKTLNISTPGAAERLRCDDRKNFFRAFVPRDYDNFKLGPNGAGVDRMTGKIKFYDNAMGGSTNDTKFRNIIGEIFNTDWSDRRNLLVDIIIVAGLSGGTGSGTFEELAVHAREACIYSGAPVVRVFGYLFLPDTVEAFVQANPEALSAIYANGYAALKELESYMSIPASPGRTEKFYSGDGVTTMKCNSDTPLFDCPVLISETYEESIRMMADLIVNLSTSGIVGMNSFYANIPTARFSYLNGNNLTTGGVLKNNVFPEDSRRYCGIGYAYAAIPKEIVTANIVGNVCQKFYQTDETGRHFCTEKKRMNRAEMETQIRRLFGFGTHDELNEMSLWNLKLRYALERCSRLSDNPVGITRRDVETGNTYTYERGFRAEECTLKGISEFAEYFTDQVRFFKENKARELVQGIVRQLIEKSKPTFKTVPGSWRVIDGFLFLPAELTNSKFATPIQQAFRDEFARIGGATYSCILADVSDIICYQVSEANALCDLKDIGKWEDFYNSSYCTISRHLCNGEYVTKFTERTKSEMEEDKARKEQKPVPELRLTAQEEILFGTGLNWEHYPPVALRNLESNEKEKEFLHTMFDPIVDYAMKEKLIERKEDSTQSSDIYGYVVHLIPDDWNNLDVENYENIGLDGRFERGENLFSYLRQQNSASIKPDQKPVILSGSGMFEKPFDFSDARLRGMNSDQIEAQSIIYMKRILRKNTELFLELRETLCRYYEIEKALELREKEYRYKFQVDKFIQCYRYGIVFYSKEDNMWRYLTDAKGNTKILCRSDITANINYTSLEKRLVKMGWEIFLVFRKFTELNFDELEKVLRQKQINNIQEENDVLLKEKDKELRKLAENLKAYFIDWPGEEQTTEEAICFTLNLEKGEEEFYVWTIQAMYKILH